MKGYPFDPAVLKTVWVLPRPYPHDPEKRAWLRKEMEEMCKNDVLERSDDVVCAGVWFWLKGRKKGLGLDFVQTFVKSMQLVSKRFTHFRTFLN